MHAVRTFLIVVTLLFLYLPRISAKDNVGPHELQNLAKAEQSDFVRSLKEMVQIDSSSNDAEGLKQMAIYIAQRLRVLGATVELLESSNGTEPQLLKGTFKGKGTLRILLIAHMDTVYGKGIGELQPLREESGKLYGPGVADDKGGIAVILHVLSILKNAGWDDFATLTVLINPDEEVSSQGSHTTITQLGAENDVVLSYEFADSKNRSAAESIVLGTAGLGRIHLKVEGRAAHAGSATGSGNALVELAHQIIQTKDIAANIPGTRLNWTMAHAGTVPNQIPATAEATADFRLTGSGSHEALFAAIKSKVESSRLTPNTEVSLVFDLHRPSFSADTRGEQLARLAQSIYSELPPSPFIPKESGTAENGGRLLRLVPQMEGGTDAAFAALSGHAVVLEGLGLVGENAHSKDEYIELEAIPSRLYLSARLLMELGKQSSGN